MTGSLMPCIPEQFYLKYDPPKITMTYHFEKKPGEKFYHEIMIPKHMLETLSDEDLCSHLYLAEAYYLDPKKIKR
jgi:hypothetical protein